MIVIIHLVQIIPIVRVFYVSNNSLFKGSTDYIDQCNPFTKKAKGDKF